MSFSDSLRLLGSLWSSSIPLAGPSKLASTGLHDSCTKGFNFLVRLAWESRYLLPIMYAVFSFIFDIQMRLEIIIHRERRVVVVEEEVLELEAEEEEEEEGTDSENGDGESVGQSEADEDDSENGDMSSDA